MRTLLYRWTKTNSVLWINTGSLVGTTAVTSMLGFAYWWVAAREFPPQAIGLGSATISAMRLLGTACILGLGTLLVSELPRQPGKEGPLIITALIIVGGIGGCVGLVFAFVAPFITTDFQVLRTSIEDIMLFASGVSLTAITFVLDQALIGLLRGELQFWHNTLFAVAKLAALFAANLWLSHTVGLTIYTTWAVGNALSLASLAGFAVLKRGGFRSTPWPEWGLLRKLGPPALQHHLLALTLQVPTLALPVLVTILFSATTNAWFYVSWMVAGFLFVVPTTITTALYAVVSGKPTALVHKTWLALSLALVASMLATCISLFGAKQVLSLFGHVYVEQAASSLRILSLGSFPMMIKHHYGAVCRIQDRMAHATLLIIAGGLLELGLAALGACLGGLPGLSLGWVAGIYVEAVFMLRTIHQGAIYQGTALFAVRQPTHWLSALKRVRKSTI